MNKSVTPSSPDDVHPGLRTRVGVITSRLARASLSLARALPKPSKSMVEDIAHTTRILECAVEDLHKAVNEARAREVARILCGVQEHAAPGVAGVVATPHGAPTHASAATPTGTGSAPRASMPTATSTGRRVVVVQVSGGSTAVSGRRSTTPAPWPRPATIDLTGGSLKRPRRPHTAPVATVATVDLTGGPYKRAREPQTAAPHASTSASASAAWPAADATRSKRVRTAERTEDADGVEVMDAMQPTGGSATPTLEQEPAPVAFVASTDPDMEEETMPALDSKLVELAQVRRPRLRVGDSGFGSLLLVMFGRAPCA